jgi:pyocin large subunit-like protein
MPLITKGFESREQLNRHFNEHGDDCRASNPREYEEIADSFLGRPKPDHVHECMRACGAIVRYDPTSELFGILDRDRVCRTFFIPVPCSSLPGAIREATRLAGRCHKHANNFVYFKAECLK